MNFLIEQIKIFFTNRIGLALVFFNLFLALWGMFEKGGRYDIFHFYYEPMPIKILTIINLPALAVARFLTVSVLSPPKSEVSFEITADFEMLHIVIFSIFQWLLIGYIFNLVFQNIREANKT